MTNEDKDDSSGFWAIMLALILVFIFLVELWQIIRFGFWIGKGTKITKFSNLDGVLFSFVFAIIFFALIIAAGFCFDLYLAHTTRTYHFDGDIITMMLKGYLCVHLLLALPIFIIVKFIHFITWVFKLNDNVDAHEPKQYENSQCLHIIPNENVTQ